MSDQELNLHNGDAIEKLDTARRKIMDQLGQVIVGQTAGHRRAADLACSAAGIACWKACRAWPRR